MEKVEMKKTNYVVVVDYKEGQTLSNCYLLGWNNNYDWFDTDTIGEDIFTSSGRVKNNKYGLIDIDRWTSVYVGEKESDCREDSNAGNKEGINCTVCRLERTEDGDYDLIPV